LHDVSGIACCNYRPKPVLPKGDTVRLIPLGDGFYAYVDAADYEWLRQYSWRLENGYAARYEKGKRIFMHRQIMEPPKGMVVDHIDGNRANDCRFNLRVCTLAENQHNRRRRRDSRSRFKGVFFSKRRRQWYATCRVARKRQWRGYFDDEIEAARAYDQMAVELFGEFARLNFPEEWPPERRAEVYAQRDAGKTKKKRAAGNREKGAGKAKKGRGKKNKPRAGTPGRRVQKRKTKSERVTGHRSRSTTRRPEQKTRKRTGAGKR
jgi:hypothetical protein